MVLANRSQVDTVIDLLGGRPGLEIVAEPVARNTAPAIAAAALLAESEDVLLVAPSDHHIEDRSALAEALVHAEDAAREGALVTFGIMPAKPETGYGYIVPDRNGSAPAISRFVEKPDESDAAQLIENGALWNSGMFVFPVRVLLEELRRFQPQLLDSVSESLKSARRDGNVVFLGPEFSEAPSISIDRAVMELTDRAVVFPLIAGWSDVGSWETLWELGAPDEDGNVTSGNVVSVDSRGNYLRSTGPLLAVSGIEDLIVVVTKDAVLVTKRSSSQTVKDIVDQLPDQYR